jgi:sporulation protein YlmC with PRC-barrel domain
MQGDQMSKQYRYAALAAALALTWGTATAQSSAQSVRADGFSQSLRYDDYLKSEDLRASKLIGERVRNAAGDSLGEIEELVIGSRDGDDTLVIVSVGGFLDVGDKLVALPYEDLRVSPDGSTLYVDRTETQLKDAPAFTYGADADVQARSERPAERVAPRAATAARATAPSAVADSNVVLDVFDYRASDLIGATVLDDRGERVAKVDDIVVSTEDDKLHAVLAIGGIVGFGEKLISIPFDDLQITANDDDPQVRIAMTGEQLNELLASRPEFRYERQLAQAPATTPRG